MAQFFVKSENVNNGRFLIDGDEAHHLLTVLRHNVGDEIRLFSGNGKVYTGCIDEIHGKTVTGSIINEQRVTERPVQVRIFQGLPKANKLEELVELATELGASEIIPIVTARSVPKIKPEEINRKHERLNKIALVAAKRACVTKQLCVGKSTKLNEAFNYIKPEDLSLIPWEHETVNSLPEILNPLSKPERINVFIGPEGGFTANEITLAKNHGAIPVSLGPNIMRTESAALMVLASIWYKWPV